ncbi:DUF465 domain-containing protein [bacterium]|nr:DUF465 domain-containing protein [bacterium]
MGQVDKEIQKELDHAVAQHRRVDLKIDDLMSQAVPDMLTIQRLKKEKLALKDEIARLRSQLTPDIIA